MKDFLSQAIKRLCYFGLGAIGVFLVISLWFYEIRSGGRVIWYLILIGIGICSVGAFYISIFYSRKDMDEIRLRDLFDL